VPEKEARRIFQQMIVAIHYCHRLGIANRDVKVHIQILALLAKLAAVYVAHTHSTVAPSLKATPLSAVDRIALTASGCPTLLLHVVSQSAILGGIALTPVY
jgi:serine/threonine protein kinase